MMVIVMALILTIVFLIVFVTLPIQSIANREHVSEPVHKSKIRNRTKPGALVQNQHTSSGGVYYTLYLHVCQLRVTVGDSGLCYTCVAYFER